VDGGVEDGRVVEVVDSERKFKTGDSGWIRLSVEVAFA
jgi:hypothetical protein